MNGAGKISSDIRTIGSLVKSFPPNVMKLVKIVCQLHHLKDFKISSPCSPVNRVTESLGHSALLSLATKLAVANSRELYKNDLTVEECKTFLGLRIQMEVSVIKPQYREYWESNGKNFFSETPGFWKVMSRDRLKKQKNELQAVHQPVQHGLGGFQLTAPNRQMPIELPICLLNVGLHHQLSLRMTSPIICLLFTPTNLKYSKRKNPNAPYKDYPVKTVKSSVRCTQFERYFCIKRGSTCWTD
ncbi:hypothetical protein PoB_003099500 [Plakobranchus ocellatus]|uniref:Uncharacterized protein n=1 Tax=Plakobranchus ocellatus TaxID=259542 RepID=A0AAV4AAR8_9GAST|nr:hypothetical protein PoB_003099500 [Plakobranchus ocellatus]